MTHIAILGFGVVGSGVADLLTNNKNEVCRLGGDEIKIKHILDLREFPDSPFADRMTKDFSIIVNDPEVSCIVEAMGGSHPAYEYTVAAIKAGKSVVTSNKEVVANFGDEFIRLAEEMGVSYRFEAAVGGGIPVISPMISLIGHNKIREVRGILNGTTNYILTKMFSYGESFEASLADAQAKGYAERNPSADILGTDACRKIAILSSLVNGRLIPTENIYTEGITAIREKDVRIASDIGMKIKLLGRCIFTEAGTQIMVAPFMIDEDSPLASVNGVYNAVEVIGDPVDRVMFYGPGAGAGPTASAIVSDVIQIIHSGRAIVQPKMVKTTEGLCDFNSFESRHYVALDNIDRDMLEKVITDFEILSSDGELVFLTGKMSEARLGSIMDKLSAMGAIQKSRIRLV